MKIISNLIYLFLFLVILFCFIIFWIKPKFSLVEFEKSIILSKQELPLGEMLRMDVGKGLLINTARPQYVLIGPYWSLMSGEYNVQINTIPYCENQNFARLELTKNDGKIVLDKKEIFASSFLGEEVTEIDFVGGLGKDYEFRLYSYGNCQFEIKKGELIRKKINYSGIMRVMHLDKLLGK